jgi:hypothetical protein
VPTQQGFINHIVNQIFDIASDVKPLGSLGEAELPALIFAVEGHDAIYCILKKGNEKYEQLSKQILRKNAEWANKFSEAYINEKLESLLIKAAQGDSSEMLTGYVNQFIADLEDYTLEYTVFLPLANLSMEIDTLEIGKIILNNMTVTFIEKLITQAEAHSIRPEMLHYQKDRERTHLRDLINQFKGDVCAEYHVIAEPGRAVERAEDECRRIFDLLRYAMALLDPNEPNKYNFDLHFLTKGGWVSSSYTGFVFAQNVFDTIPRYNRSSKIFSISSNTLERMRGIGVFDLAAILKSDSAIPEFEEILLRGIHWFADAHIQTEKENKLLSLITCLECFFSDRQADKIANSIAEGAAFTLGTNFDERKDLKEKVKGFYDKRSRVSHGGKKAILDVELTELIKLVGEILAKMISVKNIYRTQKDLFDWIEIQRLS